MQKEKVQANSVMSLAENLHFGKSASIAFDRSNAERAKPKPLYKQKEQTRKV